MQELFKFTHWKLYLLGIFVFLHSSILSIGWNDDNNVVDGFFLLSRELYANLNDYFCCRLAIFGYTTRQQFEEYFMTFLLLINNVYETTMVDEQEQLQIRTICLDAIMHLMISYRTFPIVGNTRSLYHHTPRCVRLHCDSIRYIIL